VVARKLLRVGEMGPEEFDIEFLNLEFKNATLYAHTRTETLKE
jgi:cell division protein FtsL